MGLKGFVKKQVKSVTKPVTKAGKRAVRNVGESVPGYGSYAKQIRKVLDQGSMKPKKKKNT